MAVGSTLLVGSRNTRGIRLFDVFDPTRPKQVSKLQLFSNKTGTIDILPLPQERAIVLTEIGTQFHIIDFANPRAPQRLSKLQLRIGPQSVAAGENLALVAGWTDGAYIVDISDLT